MIPELGHFALVLALVLALVQAIVPMIGASRGSGIESIAGSCLPWA